MGRPTDLDDLTAKRIVDAIAGGAPRDTAARVARIAPRTLYVWLRKGREGIAPYDQFVQRVNEAEALAEQKLVTLLRETHAPSSWQACAWLLERRRPKVWGARKPVEPVLAKPGDAPSSAEEQESLLVSMLAAARSAAS